MRPYAPRPTDCTRAPCFEPLEARQLCAVDLAGSLIAHWTFEDTGPAAAFADVSPDGPDHAATPVGDAALQAQNPGNQVLLLDGSGDRLSVGNTAEINLAIQGQRTVAFWFNADDVSINTRKQVIYEEGGTSRGLNIYLFDGRVYVGGWNIPGGSESGWSGTWLSTRGVASGRWHHVALVLDGGATTTPGALRAYLDGRAFAAGEGSQLWPHSGSITVGDHSDGTVFHDGVDGGANTAGFAGRLDDGRVYNRALADHEVLLLARGPAPTPARVYHPPPRVIAEFQDTAAPEARITVEAAPAPAATDRPALPVYPTRAVSAPDLAATIQADTDVAAHDDLPRAWAAWLEPAKCFIKSP